MPNLDYNYWSGCNSYSDPHGQTSTPAFVNATNGDFRLAAATSPGDNTLAAIYDTDSLGNTRGADGVWDRGAYEYVSGATPYCGDSSCNGTETCSTCPSDCGVCPDITPPAAPSGLTVN